MPGNEFFNAIISTVIIQAALSATCTHNAFYSGDGVGVEWLNTSGDLLEILAQVRLH